MVKLRSGKKAASVKQLIVVGASAGGLAALTTLISQLQPNFPAPLMVVQHVSADATGNVLLNSLNAIGSVKCLHAENGKALVPGYVY